jgi:hypothetical protein
VADIDALVNAIYGQESGRGANTATSVTGATGGMQIEPATFAQYARPGESINNPDDNRAVGRRIIQDLYQRAHGDPARVAVGYFSGPGNIAPSGSPTPYIHDYHDPNGKFVSSYAMDIANRLSGSKTPARPVTATPGITPPTVPTVPTVPTAPTPGMPTSVGDALKKLTTPEEEKKGPTPLQKLASAFDPQQQQQGMQQAPPMLPQAPPDQSMMLAPMAQQLLAASMGKPLSWTSQPYGAGIAGQIPGLTLNSGQQYG